MHVQNHRVIVLKYHITISHGTANIIYVLLTLDYPRQIRNHLDKMTVQQSSKESIFKIFLVNKSQQSKNKKSNFSVKCT